MKILELRFKNLNSLYGEWIIDFTDPQYVSNGIFALTGPTGAGKSTILDAICLALYGTTPRLKKITKSENEIMSRQTGECYAEVLFESQEGRFRCHWAQRKARKKAEGNLQDYRHEIIDDLTDKPIETMRSKIPAIVEEKTGMDFSRFTRSVLLAQGGFDSFLKASDDEKSKILEQLTGSEIYSQISKNVHSRRKSEEEKLAQLMAGISGITILGEDEKAKIGQEVKEKRTLEDEFKFKLKASDDSLAWLKKIEELTQDITNIGKDKEKLQTTCIAFKAERQRLELALKAESLGSYYANLKRLRKQQAEESDRQKEKELSFPKQKLLAEEQALLVKKAEALTAQTKQEMAKASQVIKQVRSYDQSIAEKNRDKAKESKIYQDSLDEITKTRVCLSKLGKDLEASKKALALNQKYLTEHSSDEWLVANLTGLEEQFKVLTSKQDAISKSETKLEKLKSELKSNQELIQKYDKDEKEQLKDINKLVEKLKGEEACLNDLLEGRVLQDYRDKKDALIEKKFLLQKIKNLEEQRKDLVAGEACPLCGSKEHPYAVEGAPEISKTQEEIDSLTKLIKSAEAKEKSIKDDEASLQKLNTTLEETKQAKDKKEHELTTKKETLLDVESTLKELRSEYSDRQHSIESKLRPLNINTNSFLINDKLLSTLKLRLQEWNSKIIQKNEEEQKKANIESEIKSSEAVLENQKKDSTAKLTELQKLSTEIDKVISDREKLYGKKSPDEEEKRLQKAISEAEESEKNIQLEYRKLQENLVRLDQELKSLTQTIQVRQKELANYEIDFLGKIQEVGFADEIIFAQALLTKEEIESLKSKAKEIDDLSFELKIKQADKEKSLEEEKAKKITEKTKEELEAITKDYEQTLVELRKELAELDYQLREDKKAKETIKEKQKAIDAQKKECQRWNKLHKVIGSENGTKYRNFAQGLTFELMVKHANRQLTKMSDRYLLIRDNNEPLELNVIDNYQAGEIRSTKNLSGGESFIVSLSLALGLSKMASRKVKVDSLFLDEGFGTLDEDALETALESLSGLQQDGKLIGIISHVTALKEKIDTQITISPVSGGHSSISGPGVLKVNKK